MPISSTTNVQSSVNLYRANQSSAHTPQRKAPDNTPTPSGPEEVFTIEISQEALNMAARVAEKKAEFTKDLKQNEAIQREANQQANEENNKIKESAIQQRIDLLA